MRVNSIKQQGFTLLEVMLVIVLVGLMISAVQFNFSSSKPEQVLQQSSARFAGIFDLAAEYGLLNNLELGLYIENNSYQFLGYDGARWTAIADNPLFERVELPETIEIELQLDELPVSELPLFDASIFNGEQEQGFSEQKEKKRIPQVYLLSGGDITPFSLTFAFTELSFEQQITYKVSGLYTTPLTIEGPLFDE